jgi:hypothetical protein
MYSWRQRVSAVLSRVVMQAVSLVMVSCVGVSAGRAMPPAAGVDLAGKQVDPVHASPGKVVVLVFVRTDCPISNRYAPAIQHISASYADKATFWLVYPDKNESSAAIERHLRQYGYRLPALHDPQHSLVRLGQAQVTPEVAVFDTSGQLVYHGRIDNWYVSFGHARPAPTTRELDDAIQAALKGSKPAVAAADGIGCYISDLE